MHGLRWRQATVQAIEAGRREFTEPEQLLLQRIFPPIELRQVDNRYIDFPGVGALEPGAFGRLVSEFYIAQPAASIAARLLKQQRARRLQPADSIVNAATRKVDGKVAKALGVAPAVVSRAALRRWGHGFVEERNQRFARDQRLAKAGLAPEKSRPMRLAWITRWMTAELEESL